MISPPHNFSIIILENIRTDIVRSTAGRHYARAKLSAREKSASEREAAARATTDAQIHALAAALSGEMQARALLEEGIRFLWDQVRVRMLYGFGI